MTNTIRFILEPYSGQRTRHTCPGCGAAHEFSRYVDTENGNTPLDDRVGKCNRTNNCNYHYKPKQYFADSGFPAGFKKSPYKSRKARVAAALDRVFSGKSTPSPIQKTKSDSTGVSASSSDEARRQKDLEKFRRKLPQWQKNFPDSLGQTYLQKRGIDAETAMLFGCGYVPEWEYWKQNDDGIYKLIGTDQRVVFPITDREGNLLAVSVRAIDENYLDEKKKTRCARKEGLFQTTDAFDADIVFLVEGPACAMTLHQCGFASVALVAASSIPSCLPNQMAFRKIVVALDADETGDRHANKHINEFRAYGARAVRMRPEGAKDWNDMLQDIGSDALREFVELRIGEAFPDFEYEPVTESEPVTEDFAIEDVFDVENESGQMAIDYLFDAAKNHADGGLLLGMPTVRAYQAGKDLVAGVGKHSRDKLTDAQLKALGDRYINAHLRSEDVSDQWTGDDVPLFYLTLKIKGERAENLTCNEIQSWIIREFWLRKSPEAEFDTMNL